MPDEPQRDLGRLSTAERLFLWRRRRGLTQAEAGAIVGVCRETFNRAEGGFATLVVLPRGAASMRPTPTEALRLARRREGLGERRTAEEAGISHQTLLKWERDVAGRLLSFWRARGYRFSAG